MDKCPYKPGEKAVKKDQSKGEFSFKTIEGNNKEQNAGQNSPYGSPGKTLHNFRVAMIFQIQPDKNQSPGKRHYTNQPCNRRKFSTDFSSQENNEKTDYTFN